MRNIIRLILFILLLEILGGLSGFVTKGSVDSWYVNLNRSPLTPPNYVFGIVWSILYAMIATSGWLIWQTKNKVCALEKSLFIFQLVLNLSWTPLFFYLQQTGLALLLISTLIVCVGYLIKRLLLLSKWSAFLLIPYLMWLLLACQLNYYIWMYN